LLAESTISSGSPADLHQKACKRVLRYIRDTIDHGLMVTPSAANQLEAFADADTQKDI